MSIMHASSGSSSLYEKEWNELTIFGIAVAQPAVFRVDGRGGDLGEA